MSDRKNLRSILAEEGLLRTAAGVPRSDAIKSRVQFTVQIQNIWTMPEENDDGELGGEFTVPKILNKKVPFRASRWGGDGDFKIDWPSGAERELGGYWVRWIEKQLSMWAYHMITEASRTL